MPKSFEGAPCSRPRMKSIADYITDGSRLLPRDWSSGAGWSCKSHLLFNHIWEVMDDLSRYAGIALCTLLLYAAPPPLPSDE